MCLAIFRSDWKILSLEKKKNLGVDNNDTCAWSRAHFLSAVLIFESLRALAPAFWRVGLSVYLVDVGLGGNRATLRRCLCLRRSLAATTRSQRTGGSSDRTPTG